MWQKDLITVCVLGTTELLCSMSPAFSVLLLVLPIGAFLCTEAGMKEEVLSLSIRKLRD